MSSGLVNNVWLVATNTDGNFPELSLISASSVALTNVKTHPKFQLKMLKHRLELFCTVDMSIQVVAYDTYTLKTPLWRKVGDCYISSWGHLNTDAWNWRPNWAVFSFCFSCKHVILTAVLFNVKEKTGREQMWRIKKERQRYRILCNNTIYMSLVFTALFYQ